MNRYRVFIVIGVAALVAGRLISPLVTHAQDDESEGIRDQLRTMTKILEASIGKESIDRRLYLSVFDSRIRTEYIPSVGAIFTIPITFPLHPSQDEKENGTEEVVGEDLWDHFSSASERASNAKAPVEPVDLVEPLKIHVDNEKERLAEEVVRLRTQEGELNAKAYALAGQDLLLSIQDGFGWNINIGNSKPYDPVKVSTLTHTIIETVAHYGHRLKSLPNSERVLVVLEAPQPRASVVFRFGEHDENMRIVRKPVPVSRVRGIIKEKKIVIEREIEERRERADRSHGLQMRGNYWIPTISRQGERDHRLLAFKKGDLQQERTYDSIKGKVETTDY